MLGDLSVDDAAKKKYKFLTKLSELLNFLATYINWPSLTVVY